jgi:hypothetical protein
MVLIGTYECFFCDLIQFFILVEKPTPLHPMTNLISLLSLMFKKLLSYSKEGEGFTR